MKKQFVIALAMISLMAWAASAVECSDSGTDCLNIETEDVFWGCTIIYSPGEWVPYDLASMATYDYGGRCWEVDWAALGEYDWDSMTWLPSYMIKASCGGGCSIQLGTYWLPAYQEASVIFT